MMGYQVYQAIQTVASETAHSARPEAPLRPEPERSARGVALRAGLSRSLRRLADAVEPAREAFEPASFGGPRSSNC